jgi:glycosyltransferase involved in cell wall biosynthesis
LAETIREGDEPGRGRQASVVDDLGGAAAARPAAADTYHVSVVVPAYNAAATVGEALESLLAQTHAAWDAIVVDDGSTDDTAAVVARFVERDARIRLVQRPNGGESAARNTGVAAARGEWLLFLDADDWIAPRHLERLTAALAADPGLDAVHCGYARVSADGAHLVDDYTPPAGDMFETLARRAAFAVHACLVRRSLVDDVGRFDESLRKSPDWDLWQRVARTGARFGHVDEVLAYYRMQPQSASLDARQMLADGLRVLAQGHAPDPRVARPHPRHAQGLATDDLECQQLYLLCWCAGLMLGEGTDPRELFDLVQHATCPRLYADAVAKTLFQAATLPGCQTPAAWEDLWRRVGPRAAEFLDALEQHSTAIGLAPAALLELKKLVLQHAPSWRPVVDDYERALAEQRQRYAQLETWHAELHQWRNDTERDRDNWRTVAEERDRSIADLSACVDRIERARSEQDSALDELRRQAAERDQEMGRQRAELDSLAATAAHWEQRGGQLADELDKAAAECERLAGERNHLVAERNHLVAERDRISGERDRLFDERDRLASERDALHQSLERRTGDFLLNRLRLRAPIAGAHSLATGAGQRATLARLAAERRLAGARGKLRVLATACWNFPIYSQTFVYQELCQLIRNGCDLRLAYSKLDARDQLQSQFALLWPRKRRLYLNRAAHERDYARYKRRLPAKVAALEEKLCQASGLSREALTAHGNYLEAFTFTRMVEAYRPHYLHSYFFYDRSLMALVAGFLLDIPRGVSCYADHMLQDYELKLVPLHLELCDVVVATSERIKGELLALAPHADAGRILVKPNGIDVERFPVLSRPEPAGDQPFRLATVCRIEPKKGLLDLVDAVALLRQRGVHVEAHIVGGVDEWSDASRESKRQLDARITEHKLWGTVHLEGRQGLEGIQRFLAAAHLFVAPFVETQAGDKDGIPTALLEAMATGLPAVGTDAGSIGEVIDQGRDGVIVPQRDAARLADAIQNLLGDPARRRSLGDAAAAKVRERFDAQICDRAFHDRIQMVCSQHREPPRQ